MKVLFITPSCPVPAHSGAAVAALETLRSIESRCDLHLLTPPCESETVQRQLQRELPGITIHHYLPRAVQAGRFKMYLTAAKVLMSGDSYWARMWFNRDLREMVLRLHETESFDIVHCEWLQPAVSLAGLDLPLLIRTHDVHFIVMQEWADKLPPRPARLFWRDQAGRFRLFEVNTLEAAECVVTLSAEDETILRAAGVSDIAMIPPPRDTVPDTEKPSNYRDFALATFLGRLDMHVNRQAFFVFVDEVWPKIPAEVREQVRIVFAGGQPAEDIIHRASENGFDLRVRPSDLEAKQLLEDTDIFLSPVQSGTGIKIKTLDAMAHGKAMIGFGPAFRGVPVEHEKNALVAETAEEFARSLTRLIYDHEKRQRIGKAARDFIGLHFSPQTLGSQLIDTYEKVTKQYQQKKQHARS